MSGAFASSRHLGKSSYYHYHQVLIRRTGSCLPDRDHHEPFHNFDWLDLCRHSWLMVPAGRFKIQNYSVFFQSYLSFANYTTHSSLSYFSSRKQAKSSSSTPYDSHNSFRYSPTYLRRAAPPLHHLSPPSIHPILQDQALPTLSYWHWID